MSVLNLDSESERRRGQSNSRNLEVYKERKKKTSYTRRWQKDDSRGRRRGEWEGATILLAIFFNC